MAGGSFFVLAVGLTFLFQGVPAAGSHQESLAMLKNVLGHKYSPQDMPMPPSGDAVQASIGLTLEKLVDIDREANEVEAVVWLNIQWNDHRLQWNAEELDDITTIRLPVDRLWVPDITLYDALKPLEHLSPELAVVSNSGDVMYVPAVRLRFPCDLKGVRSSSGATCFLKFGSWVYTGWQINITNSNDDGIDMSSYKELPRYEVLGTGVQRNVVYYPCCPEPYPDVTFNMTIKATKPKGQGSSSSSWWFN